MHALFEHYAHHLSGSLKRQVDVLVRYKRSCDSELIGKRTGFYDCPVHVQFLVFPLAALHYLVGFCKLGVSLRHLGIHSPRYQRAGNNGYHAPFQSFVHHPVFSLLIRLHNAWNRSFASTKDYVTRKKSK